MAKYKLPTLPIPDVVFFPRSVLPLSVEDPTYIKLILDTVEADGELAIPMAKPVFSMDPIREDLRSNQNSRIHYRPASICGKGKPVIVENYQNLYLKVLIKGTGRIMLKGITQNLPYPIFHVEDYPDFEYNQGSAHGLVQRISSLLEEWVYQNVPDSLEREAFFNSLSSVAHIVDYASMLMIKDPDVRQLLLEDNSLIERIHLINLLLAEGIPLQEDLGICNAMKKFEIWETMAKVAH